MSADGIPENWPRQRNCWRTDLIVRALLGLTRVLIQVSLFFLGITLKERQVWIFNLCQRWSQLILIRTMFLRFDSETYQDASSCFKNFCQKQEAPTCHWALAPSNYYADSTLMRMWRLYRLHNRYGITVLGVSCATGVECVAGIRFAPGNPPGRDADV